MLVPNRDVDGCETTKTVGDDADEDSLKDYYVSFDQMGAKWGQGSSESCSKECCGDDGDAQECR